MTIKKDKTGKTYIEILNARASFPHLFDPQRDEHGKNPKYSGTFIMSRDNPALAEISEEIQRVAKEKWPNKHAEIVKTLKAGGKLCLRSGDIEAKAKYAGFAGNVFITASNKMPIKVFNRAGEMITDGCAEAPYSGCYVNVTVELWAQNNAYGQRINASLRAVQFVSDGEPFGGGSVAADNEFGDLGEGADDTTRVGGATEEESVF